MKRNVFLEIEYIGTNYFGFQVQRKENQKEITIQSVLENLLSSFFQQPIKITASGRTDRGVHAKAHPLNFKIDTKIPLENIKKPLNKRLPDDIRIKRVKEVPWDFHSRFMAKSKIYSYMIYNHKEPSLFWHNFSWFLPDQLDLVLMREAAKKITGKRSFYCFAKDAKKYKSCIRDLKNLTIIKKRGFIYINLKADGFLRQMARNIVSFLVEAGGGKIETGQIDKILSQEKRFMKKPAPARGLYLKKVNYK
ncbi:MAG: tRNA pseudouridine(38-40) synthase TruA [Candidatus Omnitrophica bacterium]|nr:tRNA pseudouridine(38-40) synthase TruA [Candidatus Omnitrophota bacterium]MCF7877510.1 tRNA pseudouridine(38-40) synthase TruA [Candidatus Omnitrophota bacterium]MCF7877871.1 tRNA pseudouridine(38-40) synthase TruA [Candidatus Omnitrophota bacterium]MCF7892563.1 tRNA pseudouridine(38-40) synthase TruA [Candidatus Omnitrophota bacterium]